MTRSLLAQRLTAQLLAGRPARRVTDVVRRLLAVQAQDPRGMRLAVRARSSGLTAADVDRALTEDRSVVVTTLNRGTLHLVLAEDYWWLHPLTTPQLSVGNLRRLAQEQVGPDEADRGVEVVEQTLAANGPMTRAQLREALAAAGIRVVGQALPHLLLLATIRGLVVRGPLLGTEHAFVLVRDWLGRPPAPVEPEVALAELARRYLAGHGPADAADLARWAGITLGNARRGLAAVRTTPWEGSGLLRLPGHPGAAELPPPRLLGSFDPSLLGWVSRETIVGAHQGIVTDNGLFRPFAMVDGRAVAVWSLTGSRLAVRPLEPIDPEVNAALDADGREVLRFLGRDVDLPAD
ncbi:MAG: winged helix DNA-binding domain-containing protein [Actinomycetota bacterium]|nr:MAG: winged helix DNA-binding domain-containing protein [Actinomycetota bacterium]